MSLVISSIRIKCIRLIRFTHHDYDYDYISGYTHNPYNGVIYNDTILATGVFSSKELWRLSKSKSFDFLTNKTNRQTKKQKTKQKTKKKKKKSTFHHHLCIAKHSRPCSFEWLCFYIPTVWLVWQWHWNLTWFLVYQIPPSQRSLSKGFLRFWQET